MHRIGLPLRPLELRTAPLSCYRALQLHNTPAPKRSKLSMCSMKVRWPLSSFHFMSRIVFTEEENHAYFLPSAQYIEVPVTYPRLLQEVTKNVTSEATVTVTSEWWRLLERLPHSSSDLNLSFKWTLTSIDIYCSSNSGPNSSHLNFASERVHSPSDVRDSSEE